MSAEQRELLPQVPRKRGPEDVFAEQCRAACLPAFERQLVFAKELGRRWRFDFAFPDYWLAVEIDGVNVRRVGGVLITSGAHASVQGIRNDNEKRNTALLLGWGVLRFLQTDVGSRLALETTMRALSARGWKP